MRKNKKAMSTGAIIGIILLIGVGAYMFVPSFQDAVQDIIGGDGEPIVEPGKCPSSGLTEITLNTQEALASTATNAVIDYYVFEKDGTYVTTGNSGSDGQSVFNVQCSKGKTFDILVINETTDDGYYGQKIEADASEATYSKSLKMYQYGDINLVSVASSIDPSGNTSVLAGAGKTCGIVITFSENETASAFNKPLILCQTNVTTVESISLSGVKRADAKKPDRITATAGKEYHTYELDTLLKSTDAAQKVSGTITFSTSNAPGATESGMSCIIVDQATWSKAAYQTLSYNEGWVEAAENQETNSDIGAGDSQTSTLKFNNPSYC